MDFKDYIEILKKIQEFIIEYIDIEDNQEENYQNLIRYIQDLNIWSDQHEIKILLLIIDQISNHHHRHHNFFDKIEKILQTIKKEIKQSLSNFDIFKIFKYNKRILLFLIREEIITIDQNISSEMNKYINRHMKYNEYLLQSNDEITHEVLDKKRRIGENDNHICELIRNDNINDFITYVKKNNYPINSLVKPSIFETNYFLCKNSSTSLIEYATFFGSSQIFKYIYKNGCKITPYLWIYAIHGDDAEIFDILVQNKVEPPDKTYQRCIRELIMCHHNHLYEYIINNIVNRNYEDYENIDYDENYDDNIVLYSFKFVNFHFIPKVVPVKFIFFYAIELGYFTLFKYIMSSCQVDLNDNII